LEDPEMRFLSGIRFRLIALVLLALIPAWALFLHLGKAERENLVRATKREMLGLARLTSAQFLAIVEGTHHLLHRLAKTREVREGASQACSELFASVLEGHPLYANLLVTGPDGKAWCSAIPEALGVDYSDRDWFQRAIVERRFVMGAYVVGKATGKPVAPSAYPVLDDSGELAGVIVAALDLSWLNRMLAGLPLPEGAVINILGADGTVLARSSEPEKWVGQSALQTEIGRWVLEHPDQQTAESAGMDGRRRLYAYTQLGEGSLIPQPSAMGYVLVGIPKAQVQEASDRVLLRSVMGLSAVTLLSLAIAWLGGDYLVRRRITSLLSATRRMAQGDLSARTAIPYGKSELSELARGFDEMAQKLEHQQRDLRGALGELKERDERLSHLLEVSPAVIYTTAPGDLRLTWVSPNVRDLLGFSPEEVLEPKWWEENLHPEDVGHALSRRADLLANGHMLQEYRFKAKDGRFMILRDETRLLRGKDGKPLEVIGAWVDVTERMLAEDTILKQLQSLTALFDGAQQLAERLDLQAAAKEVARICVEVLGASLAWLGRKEPDGVVKLISQFPEDHPYPRSISLRWDETPEGQGPTGRAIRGGNPEICSDILQEPSFGPWREAAQAHGFKSCVAIPLITRGKVFGALNLYSAIPGFFAPDTMEPLKALANLAAAALENARLFTETTSRLKKVQALRNIDMAITSSLDPRVTLRILLDEVTTQLRVDAADVLLLNPYSQALEYAAGRGFRGGKIEATRMRLGEGYAGRAALERRVLEVRDLA
jgi:PAS domain S-box-containing protein